MNYIAPFNKLNGPHLSGLLINTRTVFDIKLDRRIIYNYMGGHLTPLVYRANQIEPLRTAMMRDVQGFHINFNLTLTKPFTRV